MTDNRISELDVVQVSKNQVSANLQDEEVILNMEDGVYYGLNTIGARVWRLIQEPKTVKEIQETLLEEFDVESDQCMRKLTDLLLDMERRNLIEVKYERIA